MANLLSALNMNANSLKVNENAISVVSNNVANMNTIGYHKQTVNLATRTNEIPIGNNVYRQIDSLAGVQIASVTRSTNKYLDNAYRGALAQLGCLQQQQNNISDIADLFDELDGTGIDAGLKSFFEALNDLNNNPTDSTARVAFLESAQTLTSLMNTTAEKLQEQMYSQLGDGVSADALADSPFAAEITNINDLFQQLADVNESLARTQTGNLTANNLLDTRDTILDKISEYMDFDLEEYPNGTVRLSLNGVDLVKGTEVLGKFTVQTASEYCAQQGITYPDDWDGALAVVNIESTDGRVFGNINDTITTGKLGGYLTTGSDDAGTVSADYILGKLDQLAVTIADIFNALQTDANAYCIDPTTWTLSDANRNVNIFVSSDGGAISATNIKINDDLLADGGQWLLATAYFDDPAQFDANAVGNNSNVVNMLNTREAAQAGLGGLTFEDFYSALVGSVGTALSNIDGEIEAQQSIVDNLDLQRTAEYSVDLNSELTDLIKYQTAYSAAARIFTTCNSLLDVLVSLGG